MAFSENFQTTEIFRLWSALWTVGSVIEQKVWIKGTRIVYPNMYVFLVGPSGHGKGEAFGDVGRLLEQAEGQYTSPNRASIQALADAIGAARRRIITADGVVEFNSIKMIAPELGIFLNVYDPAIINNLTDFWDGTRYVEQKRHMKGEKLIIERPQISILAGTTPAFLANTLPEGAWGEGFMSRTIMVYSGDYVYKDFFGPENILAEELFDDLKHDIKIISELYGQITVLDEVAAAFRAWNLGGREPLPLHPKLESYNARRAQHLLKLALICCVSRSNDLILTLEDYSRAFQILTNAETFMPEVMKAGAASSDGRAMEDTWHFIFTEYNRGGRKGVSQARVLAFLKDRVQTERTIRIIDMMERIGNVKAEIGVGGQKFYAPGPKKAQ